MNRVLLALGTFLIFMSACNKTDSPITAEEDLRSGTWRRTSGKVTFKDPQTNGDSTTDYTTTQPACRLDNALNFMVNFQGNMDLGSSHCTSGEPGSKPFTWQITADGKKISLYNVGDFFPAENIDADVLTRTLGYLTIRYKVITVDPIFSTADTSIFTDVLRRN